jgi:hypothetical protein
MMNFNKAMNAILTKAQGSLTQDTHDPIDISEEVIAARREYGRVREERDRLYATAVLLRAKVDALKLCEDVTP